MSPTLFLASLFLYIGGMVGLFTFLSSVGWLGAHILGGGKYLEFVTGIHPLWAKSWIALGFGIYAIIGGDRAVVWTDTIQAVVLFAGFLGTALFAFRSVGGWDGLQEINTQLATQASGSSGLQAASLIVVIAVGVLVSLLTPPEARSHDESLQQLQRERQEMNAD
jgi:SSS family solute:Na+ symporter